jgi:aminopeptidase N
MIRRPPRSEEFDDFPKGFYRTFFINDENYEQVWLISTFLQPTNARMAFPCYDEPQIRATFRLQIKHDKSYHAISNTPAVNVTDHQNYVVTSFETTPLMQSYLLAFVVSKFEAIENRDLNFPQRIFGDPQKIANGDGEFAIKIVSEVYLKIVEVFNFSIPLTKLDHAGIPRMIGALETFGLITYNEDFLLLNKNYDEKVLNFFRPQTISYIAHEIVHQLIGNTVAIGSWQYLWMNEALAMFFHHYIPSLLYPEFDFMEIFRTQVLGFSFVMDHDNETMNEYVESPEEIRNKFNSISFEKSAAVIRMFFEALTPATFIKGLNYYLREMQFKTVVPDDFHRALQRAYDEDNKDIKVDVGKMMEKWENLPGFPLLSVSRDGDKIVVKQKRYKLEFEGEIFL